MQSNLPRVAFRVCVVALAFGFGWLGSTAAAPLMVSATRAPDKPWSEFPTRLVSSLPGYRGGADGELSNYGGLKDEPGRATGFFRAEKIGGRWWLIDPDGCRFINVGLVDVHLPPGSSTVKTAMQEKFGTTAHWAEATTEQLRSHGFNGTGAWSDFRALGAVPHPAVYTLIWNFMSEYGKQRGGTYQESGHTGYPKGCIFVFDPEFAAFCDDYAKKNLAATKDDPWLLGHFSDNELPFQRLTLDSFLTLPERDPGRLAAEQWLKEWRGAHAKKKIDDEDRQAFLGFVVDRYLRLTTAAIRKYDPNHLCLGSRFHSYELDVPPVFAAAGRYLDVIAINYYRAWTPEPARMRHWAEWSSKPFLVTEWYAKGMDSGYANMSGAGWTVKTQQDRGRFYQNFALGLLESRACVGWHWFKYMDNDPADLTTDPSNRDSNKGVVTLKFEPYTPLLDAMTELNRQVYSLAHYFDQPVR